jgi:hypothetical protein
MVTKVAVLVIHGMGSQDKYFADAMRNEINNRVDKKGKDSKQIAWQPIYWADVLQPRQDKFIDDIVAARSNDIDYVKLRRFIVSAIGDAAAYRKTTGNRGSTYNQIHGRVQTAVKALYNNQLQKQDCPLIVMAHSLGGHIMSNYIWDKQKRQGARLSDFENMRTLAGMITFGCNIPLFSFAHEEFEPISFPGDKLSDTEKSKAKWNNYYDPDDILGYPLRQINRKYAFVKDKAINVGGWLSSWNPASHSGYWTDNDFTKPATNQIVRFL